MTARAWLKTAARRIPAIGTALASRDDLLAAHQDLVAHEARLAASLAVHQGVIAEQAAALAATAAEVRTLRFDHRFVPPGHFYSPIPDLAEVERDGARLFGPPPRTLPGIDLREAEQLALFERFQPFFADLPFGPAAAGTLRFGYENGAFSYADAIMLFCMLRDRRPRRIIEVGSGHSSCVILDTVELFLNGSTEIVLVEPFPALLHSLLKPGDAERITIVPQTLQATDPALFETLEPGDILFVDSTHVGKIGSDVNALFNDVLPRLRPGVAVHFHDIFYPFEYPKYWIEDGRAWNEAYMLRCFLQFNQRFRVLFWTDFLTRFHLDRFRRDLPLALRNTGASLWLEVA